MCPIQPLQEEHVFTATDLFRGNSAVMLVIDPVSLTVIDANDAAIAFFGYAKETFLGMPVSAFGDGIPEKFTDAVRGGAKRNRRYVRVRARCANGEVRIVDVYRSSILLEGRPALLALVHDMTGADRMRRELRFSTERFRTYVEHVPIGVFVADAAGNVIDVNPAFLRLTGREEGQLVKGPVWSLLPPEAAKEARERIERLADEDSWVFSCDRNGVRHWRRIDIVRIEDGQILGYMPDVTAQHRVLLELEERNAQLEQLFMCAPMALQLWDVDGAILRANPANEKLFGYGEAELAGKNVDDVLVPEEDREQARKYTRMLAERDSLSFEATRLRKDGARVEVAFTGFPVMFSPGKSGIYAVYQDIGARKEAERRALDYNRRLHEDIAALEKARLQTIRVLAATTEARDPYTAGHQRRVAHLSKAIALEMGVDPEEARHIELAAMVHDLGKIETPSEILGKTKKLSRIEFELVREHAAAGYRLLKGIELPWPLAEIVYEHHERLDGSGYPRGLSGDAILPAARIIGVADVVEAMASHRPYRPALGIDAALDEVESKKGTMYDPAVVDACARLFREDRVRLEE